MAKPAPVKIRGVHHFAMSVPSLEAAIAFYRDAFGFELVDHEHLGHSDCLLYTSPSPRDLSTSRMPSSA